MAIDRSKVLEATLKDIRSKIPDLVIDKYENMSNLDVDKLGTGSIAMDAVLGGGIGKGRLVEIVGKASSGKTTLCLTIIAALQREKPDAVIVYIDSENALDPIYMKQLGVDMSKLIITQPMTGEEAYTVAESFVASGVCDLVVCDSIPAMIPEATLNYEFDETPKIGLVATLHGRGVSRLFNRANKTGCTVIMINQYRDRTVIGMPTQGDGVSGSGYLPGGQTIPFYFSQILKIQRVGKVKEGVDVVADQIRMWAIKNKIGRPYVTADFYIAYGRGIDTAQEVIEFGDKYGLITRTSRTYAVLDPNVEQPEDKPIIIEGSRQSSRQAFVNYLNRTPEVMDMLVNKIKERIKDDSDNSAGSKEAADEAEEMGADIEA